MWERGTDSKLKTKPQDYHAEKRQHDPGREGQRERQMTAVKNRCDELNLQRGLSGNVCSDHRLEDLGKGHLITSL